MEDRYIVTKQWGSNFLIFFLFFGLHLVYQAYQAHDGPPTDMYIEIQVESLERKIGSYTRSLTSVGWCIKKSYTVKPSSFVLYNIFFITLHLFSVCTLRKRIEGYAAWYRTNNTLRVSLPPPKNIKFSRFVNLFLYSQGAWRRPSKARAKFEWGF